MSFECKIRPFAEIREAVGARPRRRKVVLCHGTFDLLHPGHVRHLAYAKSKGGVLIVSVVADQYVTRRTAGMPEVSEDDRAFGLSVLEMVDFVFVNVRPTPLYVIGALQPDSYGRNFDYAATSVAEIEAVKSYGGKVI